MSTKDISDLCEQDYLDVHDVIARVEELQDEREQSDIPANEYGGPKDTWAEERTELATLESLLDDLKGNGGDKQWRGDWYPVTLIADSSFNDAMDELLQDIGDLPKNIPSYLRIEVDYDALQMDYTSCEFEGTTYWYR